MNKKQQPSEIFSTDSKERGQSIVLITFALVGLLAFAGIAIDTGFTFARSSQLQAAVDAAALAAVTEMTGGTLAERKPFADTAAGQFLNANNVPVGTTIIKNGVPITTTMVSTSRRTELGATEYSLTVTWPVEHYFLQLVGWDVNTLSKSATAAYFPLADIYASRRIETGALNTSNQSVFGQDICTDYGDAFSPHVRTWTDSSPPNGVPYSYQYRILIPASYPSDVLRVEIFDPDSINQAENTHHVNFTNNAIGQDNVTYPSTGKNLSCATSQRDNCLIETAERDLVDPNGSPPIELEQVNPFWFVRVDENRGTGTSGVCGAPSSYTPSYNTRTLYELFYYVQNADGTIARVDLARYTGQVGDNVRDTGDHKTDMHWVSPGGTMLYDQPANVPVDPGSPGDFELSISGDLPGILIDPGTGNKYVYLNVTAGTGASENGYEIWAGPWYPSISSNVNTRNIQVLNDPTAHAAKGTTVYGMGRLPMNSNYSNPVDIPLIWVGPELAGQSVFVSLFDTDAGAQPPITFYFDSIAEEDFSLTFGAGDPDPDGVSGRCKPGSCNNQWVNPSYEIVIPGNMDNCDWNNQTQADCTPFYGGRLVARYQGGQADTYGWQINVSGLPYLVK